MAHPSHWRTFRPPVQRSRPVSFHYDTFFRNLRQSNSSSRQPTAIRLPSFLMNPPWCPGRTIFRPSPSIRFLNSCSGDPQNTTVPCFPPSRSSPDRYRPHTSSCFHPVAIFLQKLCHFAPPQRPVRRTNQAEWL